MAEQDEANLLRWLGRGGFTEGEPLATVRRIIAERDAAQRVARELVDFHNDYKRNTLGCDMPGNDIYSGLLMDIVRHAREALKGTP